MNESKVAALVAYPYLFKHDGCEYVLLWIDGGRERDYFLKTSAGQLFIVDSLAHMRKECHAVENITIHWDEPAQIDFDQFWKKLSGLRNGRASSQETCRVILEGWNFLEDVALTLAVRADLPSSSSTNEVLQRAYEKIFAGCNLPSMTPEGREYQAIWQTEEIAVLRSALRQLWQCLGVKLIPS